MVRLLKDFLPKLIPLQHDWKVKLLHSWGTIMGRFSSKVRLEKIEEDLLVLGVFDACWMQELYLLTPTLLLKINESLDQPRIKQLRFKRAGLEKRSQCKTVGKKIVTKRQERALTVDEKQVLNSVKDEQLRDALLSFLQQCQRD